MSTYETLKGLKVKYLAADPDPGTAGDVWYDSATYELKSFIAQSAWASVSPLVTAKSALNGGAGTQTAGIVFGGSLPAVTAVTEEFDGTNWAAGGSLNTARSSGASAKNGSQTASLSISGYNGTANVAIVESYDGTTWTSLSNMNIARVAGPGGFGSNTLAVTFGGQSPGGKLITTEEFNIPATAIKTFTVS